MPPTQQPSSCQSRELPPARATFILRLQRAPQGQASTVWRGTVEHVQSGERRAVPDVESAAALVAGWLCALEEEAADVRSG